MAVGKEPGSVFGTGKNVPLIAMAHFIPYVATASVANLHDLEFKVTKAIIVHGARTSIHVPCLGLWRRRTRSSCAARRGDRALPAFGAEDGEITGRTKIRRKARSRITRLQSVWRIFSVPNPTQRASPASGRTPTAIAKFGLLDWRTSWKSLLLNPARPGQQDGSWRVAADVPRPAAALQPCVSGGENIQAWLYPAAVTTKQRGDSDCRQSARDHGTRLLHPCEGACNRGKLTSRSASIPSSVSWRRGVKHGWQFAPPAFESGKHVLVVGAGPSGLRRLSPAPAGPPRQDHRGGSAVWRDDALRHSQVPVAARRADAEVKRILDMVCARVEPQGDNIIETMQAGQFRRGLSCGRLPTSPSAPTFRGRSGTHAGRGVRAAEHGRRRSRWGGESSSTAAAMRRSRRAHGQTAGRLRGDHRVSPQPRKMPAHDFEVEEALREAC
jgi:hypothetical protein